MFLSLLSCNLGSWTAHHYLRSAVLQLAMQGLTCHEMQDWKGFVLGRVDFASWLLARGVYANSSASSLDGDC